MSILFQSIEIRHERRVRLLFTNTLAAGAFTTLSLYVLASTDETQPTPSVVAALVVPNITNAVDIALDTDLTNGAPYTVTAVGVPATDSSSTPAGSVLPFALPVPQSIPNQEIGQDDVDALTYGVDLVHDGTDYVEGPDGDLETLTGPTNAISAVLRRELSDGLPWDFTYGGKFRDMIDGPSVGMRVKGRILRQGRVDDRVAAMTATPAPFDPTNPGSVSYNVGITLIGGETVNNLPLRLPGS